MSPQCGNPHESRGYVCFVPNAGARKIAGVMWAHVGHNFWLLTDVVTSKTLVATLPTLSFCPLCGAPQKSKGYVAIFPT